MSKLGRGRVCLLYKDGVTIPSDLHGVVYVKMGTDGKWQSDVAKEMQAVGLHVDLNKL